jgi:hypothetical protein
VLVDAVLQTGQYLERCWADRSRERQRDRQVQRVRQARYRLGPVSSAIRTMRLVNSAVREPMRSGEPMSEVVQMRQQDDRNGPARLSASGDRDALEHVRARRVVLADPVLRLSALAALGWLALFGVLTAVSRGSAQWTRFVSDVVYVVLVAVAAVLAVMAARRYTGRTGLLWRLLAVSNGLWLCVI